MKKYLAGLGLLLSLMVANCPGDDKAASPAPTQRGTQAAKLPKPDPKAPLFTPPSYMKGDLPNARDRAAVQTFRGAMVDFSKGMSREKFLAACEDIAKKYADHYGRQCEAAAQYIAALKREAAQPVPAFVGKPADRRTPQEAAAYSVYQLREFATKERDGVHYPAMFARDKQPPTAADRVVAHGTTALPYLMVAIEDGMPTRTIAKHSSWRHEYLLPRRDVAIRCLERITGCRFYGSHGDLGRAYPHFSLEQRNARFGAMKNIRSWWAASRGKSSARMIRNQIALMPKNPTLGKYYEVEMLGPLAEIEGAQAVMPRLCELLESDLQVLRYGATDLAAKLDRPAMMKIITRRFWKNQTKDTDYRMLVRYGDQEVYKELGRRLERLGRFDPDNSADILVLDAVRRRGAWALPMLACLFREGKALDNVRHKRFNDRRDREFHDERHKEWCMEAWVRLTGMDFGYRKGCSTSQCNKAVRQVWPWWDKTGRRLLAPKIKAKQPPAAKAHNPS